MAYAYLAGMPPQYGLYAALVPILVYALFGTSPHLAIGPVAISSILVLTGVGKLEDPFSQEYIQLVILAGFWIGIMQVLFGILKLGRYVNLLSYPVITGFTSAASIIVITSQLKDVLGIDIPRFEFLHETFLHTIEGIHETHLTTLGLALATFSAMFVMRKFSKKIPSGLVVVVVGIVVSYFFQLEYRGVAVIGFVPEGLPEYALPSFTREACLDLIPTIVLVSLVGVVECIGIAKAIENKNQFYEVHTNKELFALGLSKIAGSFFSALPSSGSFSRSALLHETRAKTTIASLITLFFVVLSLLFLTSTLAYLPKVILAVIIIYAVKNLFEYQMAQKLRKEYPFDFAVMLCTFFVTLFVSIEVGIATGFVISLFNLRSSNHSLPKGFRRIISQNYAQDIYFDTSEPQNNHKHLIVNENMHFGNAGYFKDLVKKELDSDASFTVIIIQFNESVKIDSTAMNSLNEIIRLLQTKDIECQCKNLKATYRSRLFEY